MALLVGGCVGPSSSDGPGSGRDTLRSGEWSSTSGGSTYGYEGTSYGGSTYGYEGTSHGGSTYGYDGTSYGSMTYGYDGSTSGWSSTALTYDGSSSDGGWSTSTVTTDATTSASPATSTSATTTGGGQWYAIPSGDLDAGFSSYVTDNPACSGLVDEVLSECIDEYTLEYPDFDECTQDLNKSQENCQTWCQDQGHDDGSCLTEAEGPDHCECTLFRQEIGVDDNEVPGCVATYQPGDAECSETPREYAVATCKYDDPDSGEKNILVNKTTSTAGCAESDIEEEELNCKGWCRDTYGIPMQGHCGMEASESCGGEEAARCFCSERMMTNAIGAANLASCQEDFEKADACPDGDGTPTSRGGTCYKDTIHHYPTVGCTEWGEYMDGDNVHNIDCNDWCKDEGHDSGTCEEATVEVTCPSGAKVHSAQCVCS